MNDHHQWGSAMVLSASGLGSFAAVLAVVEADARMPDVVGLQSVSSGRPGARPSRHNHYRRRYADLRTYSPERSTLRWTVGRPPPNSRPATWP